MEALNLIAEARRLQERAEKERDYWKEVARYRHERCKAVIKMAKRLPLKVPEVTKDGDVNYKSLEHIVDEFARVISDPYARFPDDDDIAAMTHDRMKMAMIYRLQYLIKRAVSEAKGNE